MIPPDREIYEVEKRIAERRQRVEAAFKATGRQALRSLSSPLALAAAGLAGFLLAGGVRRRRGRERVEPAAGKAGKASALSSAAMAVATWLIKSQFGSPVDMARFFIDRIKSRKASAPERAAPSRVPDRLRPKRRQATTAG
ncbi:MAG TPA: hypothetical protein VF211_13700 [Burkholderiales bacterium]